MKTQCKSEALLFQTQSRRELVAQRVYALALGYEDLNDD